MDETTLEQLLTLIPIIIFCLAGLIVAVIGTFAFITLRRSPGSRTRQAVQASTEPETEEAASPAMGPVTVAADIDPEEFLAEQRGNLQEFSLEDLSVAFRGVSGQGYRQGTIVHHSQPVIPLISFVVETSGGQMGLIRASTVYGDMELTVTAGRADLDWNGDRLGALDYGNQRILGPEGQLRGELPRPAFTAGLPPVDKHFPISFLGKKAGELHCAIEGLSNLRWLTDTDAETYPPAFTETQPELDDSQQIFMMAALVMEVGFFDFVGGG
jgi:hypothetical protein